MQCCYIELTNPWFSLFANLPTWHWLAVSSLKSHSPASLLPERARSGYSQQKSSQSAWERQQRVSQQKRGNKESVSKREATLQKDTKGRSARERHFFWKHCRSVCEYCCWHFLWLFRMSNLLKRPFSDHNTYFLHCFGQNFKILGSWLLSQQQCYDWNSVPWISNQQGIFIKVSSAFDGWEEEFFHLELLRCHPGMQQIGEVCVEPIGEAEPETDKGALSHMERRGLVGKKRHSHCDIARASHYHGVWDHGYAGGLQDGRVLVLIFVDRIEVSHLWLLSGWKWWDSCRAPNPTSGLLLPHHHSTNREDDRKENSRTILTYYKRQLL